MPDADCLPWRRRAEAGTVLIRNKDTGYGCVREGLDGAARWGVACGRPELWNARRRLTHLPRTPAACRPRPACRFYVPVGSLEAERSQELRRRVKLGGESPPSRLAFAARVPALGAHPRAPARPARPRPPAADVQADGVTEDEVIVDGEHRTYRLKSYPALGRVLLPSDKWGFMRNMYWYIVFGAFLFAACAQIKFYFPCFNGYTAVPWGGNSYCVPDGRVGEVGATCPADICSKRIPVNLSTYAAMLNGALAGMTGVWATVLYVAMVCVGAPFGSSSISEPVWKKGAIIGSTGGFFWGAWWG
jgi:hypothetical protein